MLGPELAALLSEDEEPRRRRPARPAAVKIHITAETSFIAYLDI
jgi:hypothetical protein